MSDGKKCRCDENGHRLFSLILSTKRTGGGQTGMQNELSQIDQNSANSSCNFATLITHYTSFSSLHPSTLYSCCSQLCFRQLCGMVNQWGPAHPAGYYQRSTYLRLVIIILEEHVPYISHQRSTYHIYCIRRARTVDIILEEPVSQILYQRSMYHIYCIRGSRIVDIISGAHIPQLYQRCNRYYIRVYTVDIILEKMYSVYYISTYHRYYIRVARTIYIILEEHVLQNYIRGARTVYIVYYIRGARTIQILYHRSTYRRIHIRGVRTVDIILEEHISQIL